MNYQYEVETWEGSEGLSEREQEQLDTLILAIYQKKGWALEAFKAMRDCSDIGTDFGWRSYLREVTL